MGRALEIALIVYMVGVIVVTAVALNTRPPTRPMLDNPQRPTVENIETIGPAALCTDGEIPSAERGADGVTVHWCEASAQPDR